MTRKSWCATALITFTCVLALGESPALAGDAATAEALFREGRTLMDAGNYAAACPKLEESYAQDPATGTLLALGICQERVGKRRARGRPTPRRRREPSETGEAIASAPRAITWWRSSPSFLISRSRSTPSASAVTGFSVKRDGHDVGAGAWGTSVPIDPGEHVVEATAPGRRAFNAKITVTAQGAAETVQIPALELARGASRIERGPGRHGATRRRRRDYPHGCPASHPGLDHRRRRTRHARSQRRVRASGPQSEQ